MATQVRLDMVEEGFATLSALAALRSIFVGQAFVLPYQPTDPWWLPAYGQLLNIVDYPALYAKYGTLYGGNGATTFGMPDFRGRAIAGLDNMGGTSANRLTSPLDGDTLGAVGGAQSVVMTLAQMPRHAHTLTMNAVPPHTHTVPTASTGGGDGAQTGPATGNGITTNPGGGHTPTGTIGETGSGEAHPNVQPTIIQCIAILAY